MTSALWFVQSVSINTYLGTSADGPSYGATVAVPCWVEESIDVLSNAQGVEVVSTSTRVYGAIADVDKFVPNSRVVLPSGRDAQVIAVARFESGSLALPVDHFQAALT